MLKAKEQKQMEEGHRAWQGKDKEQPEAGQLLGSCRLLAAPCLALKLETLSKQAGKQKQGCRRAAVRGCCACEGCGEVRRMSLAQNASQRSLTTTTLPPASGLRWLHA